MSARISSLLMGLAVLLSLIATPVGATVQSKVTEYSTPTGSSLPSDVITGRDGNVWFTEQGGNNIGRITPDGQITEFPLPVPDSLPLGITAGPDGAVWFTEQGANSIGRITQVGHLSEFLLPLANREPDGIATGADGNLWFTGDNLSGIGRLTPSGNFTVFFTDFSVTKIAAGADGNLWFTDYVDSLIGSISTDGMTIRQFPLPPGHQGPWDIAAGPDGNMWFTALNGTEVGRITPDGTITEFPVGGSSSAITGIAAGHDGNLWFTEGDIGRIGVMDPTGQVIATYGGAIGPAGIAVGADGNLWFADASASAIGRVRTARSRTRYSVVQDSLSPAVRILPRPGAIMQWSFYGPSQHDIVDATGIGLFDSGPRSFVEYYTFTFTAAGNYPYQDSLHQALTGTIEVPVGLPSAGNVGQPFTVIWAVAPPPPDYVFDVQVDPPGGEWSFFQHGVTAQSAAYTPQSAGTYAFRARLRGTSASSRWSIIATILVG